MTDKTKSQADFLPRLEKDNVRASGYLIPPAAERTPEREEVARQLVREDILAAVSGVPKSPKVCFIDPQKAASYDLRSGQPLQHCSEEQVKQFNEEPYPRLGRSFLLKSSEKKPNVVTIPTQVADLQVFLTNGDEEKQYLGEMVDLEALVQEAALLEANALLIPLSQTEGNEEGEKQEASDTKIQFDAGGYERSRNNTFSREKSANVERRYTRTQAGWGRNQTEEEKTRQAREQAKRDADRYRGGKTRRTGGFKPPSLSAKRQIAGGDPVTSNWDAGDFEKFGFKGKWQTGATNRGAGIAESLTINQGVGYNANAHIDGSVAHFDAKTNFSGPVSGSASGSALSYSAEADANIVLGKEFTVNGRLGASADLAEISGKGKVKITPQRAWHATGCAAQVAYYSLKNWEFSRPEQDVDFVTAFPACEEEEGLDDGFGLTMGLGLGAQAGIGAEIGGQLDLGGNDRAGFGLDAKGTLFFGFSGGFYIGADWSSKKKE